MNIYREDMPVTEQMAAMLSIDSDTYGFYRWRCDEGHDSKDMDNGTNDNGMRFSNAASARENLQRHIDSGHMTGKYGHLPEGVTQVGSIHILP